MRKLLVLIAVVFALMATKCYAGIGDDNSVNNKAYGGDADQHQKQSQYQGQNQNQSSKQANGQTTNIGGDTNEVTTAVWPTTPSTSTKEERSIYTLFGGIGSNNTEMWIRLQEQMKINKVLLDQGVITQEEYQVEARRIYKQIKRANREKKLLGVTTFAADGCNVLNACSLLTF